MTNKTTLKPARQADSDPFARFSLQPQMDQKQETRRDRVRAIYLGLLVFLFVGVVIFACYANQFGDWVKAKDLLAVILPALTALIGAGTTFYFKNPEK
jgi:hypothetical protein